MALLGGAMLTYLALNGLFLAVLILLARQHGGIFSKPFIAICAVLLLLTLVFDSCIIAAQIVAYDSRKILGVYAWRAPIEDFAYAIAAVMITKLAWDKLA